MAVSSSIDKMYDRCAYLNCYNGKNSTGHRLFRFPAYNDTRHNLWIRYTGNVRLRKWSSATIRRSGICGDHFGPESFTDETRQSLRRHAVPKPYSAITSQTKPSQTLLAHIKSLPRERTRSRNLIEIDNYHKELPNFFSPKTLEQEDSSSVSERFIPSQTHVSSTMKTFRKIKMIKIEEQNSNANKTVILERCKNPETCPANRQSTQIGEKNRRHFHKIYVNNSEISKPASLANLGVSKRSEKNVSEMKIVGEELEESCEDNTNITTGDDDASNDKIPYRLERYLINVTPKNTSKELITSRSNEKIYAQRNSNISIEKDDQKLNTIPASISEKHPSTKQLVKDYYKRKDERVFDRCAYLNCKNGRYTTGARLFRFPQWSDPRLNTWIKNAGNPRMLYWSSATIRRAGLCGDHFTDESFFNATRQRLLRNALPKPFHLDDTKESGTKLQDENLTRDDLIRIFEGLDENVCEETTPALIDLPDDKSTNQANLKIKYTFEDGVTLDDNDDEQKIENIANTIVKNELINENENVQERESSVKVNVKNEPPDETNDDNEDELSSFTSESIDIKDELVENVEDSLLDDTSLIDDLDFEFDDDEESEEIRKIIALKQQKVELCKTIKQFSTKLKNAKLQKQKLRSQLLAYNEFKMN